MRRYIVETSHGAHIVEAASPDAARDAVMARGPMRTVIRSVSPVDDYAPRFGREDWE
jgi:hypothetical protein